MEGKSILFKEFADVDAFPIVLDTKDVDEIVEKARHKIFLNYPIFDENHRAELEKKILKHYLKI